MKLCSAKGCDRKHRARGYRLAHYQQLRSGKTPAGPVRPNRHNGATAVRDELGRKQCVACEEWLEPELFSAHNVTVDRLQVRCRACLRVSRYGLTVAEIRQRLEQQDHRCPICGAGIGGRFVIDHDHSCCDRAGSCGKCVRALLCDGCNLGLGSFKDSPDALRAAALYLERHRIMNYPPIGGYEHSEACDEGDPARMCEECLIEADREWAIPEGTDQ